MAEKHLSHLVDQKYLNQPIVLLPNIFTSSDCWFWGEENQAPGFWLLSKGCELWCVNYRGNKYSLEHTNPNIHHSIFFDFNLDDIGTRDIPAVYRYVMVNSKFANSRKIVLLAVATAVMLVKVCLCFPSEDQRYVAENTKGIIYYGQFGVDDYHNHYNEQQKRP